MDSCGNYCVCGSIVGFGDVDFVFLNLLVNFVRIFDCCDVDICMFGKEWMVFDEWFKFVEVVCVYVFDKKYVMGIVNIYGGW